jgi:8-oxo-dGTP pyrophosphatase MutT (NUDIX family)
MNDPGTPASVAPLDAASVILMRPHSLTGEAEIFLLRRHSRSGFMASAFVFPGGVVEPEDRELREAAVRELFEEAGVLLAGRPVSTATLNQWRRQLWDGKAFREIVDRSGVELALDALGYFGHWITPSVEGRRYSARFFVAELPAGQNPTFDDLETVEQLWITPSEALARAGELRLPPPQMRTLYDLAGSADNGPSAVWKMAEERARHPHPIMPRAVTLRTDPETIAVLLPWDPEYAIAPGEGLEIPADHPLASGPSRLVLTGNGWQLVDP